MAEKSHTIGVRVQPEIAQRLEKIAEALGLGSPAGVLRDMLHASLPDYERRAGLSGPVALRCLRVLFRQMLSEDPAEHDRESALRSLAAALVLSEEQTDTEAPRESILRQSHEYLRRLSEFPTAGSQPHPHLELLATLVRKGTGEQPSAYRERLLEYASTLADGEDTTDEVQSIGTRIEGLLTQLASEALREQDNTESE